MITLRIPQLVCLGCARSVPFTHPLLPRRKRLWRDFDQDLTARSTSKGAVTVPVGAFLSARRVVVLAS